MAAREPDAPAWTTRVFPRCTVHWRRSESAFENVVVGHMTEEVAVYLQRAAEPIPRDATALHDWSAAPTYDVAYRRSWQRWLSAQLNIAVVHFHCRSRVLRMGISVANLAYPRIDFVVHATEAAYAQVRRRYFPDPP